MNMNVDVPQIVRATDDGRRYDRSMVTVQMYKAPLDGSPDLFRDFDLFVAGRINEILTHHYPGYPWMSESNAKHGIVHFGIPVLMGPTLRWVIKLGEWSDLQPKLVIDGGGELLERFNLPRKGFEAASFVGARDNRHLAQIDFKKRSV